MRNNLDDVLRKNKSVVTPLPSSQKQKVIYIVHLSPFLKIIIKSFKFKPATTVSSASLPSFSTPGFGKLGTIGGQPGVTPRPREVISISSDSNSSSPQSIKRTSSDPSFTSDPSPQSSKRLKMDRLAEKENLFQPILHSDFKGKAKHPFYASHTKLVECSDDEARRKIKFDSEHNPWAKLDRDFPSYSSPGPFPEGLVIPDLDSDLLSVRNCSFDLVLIVCLHFTHRKTLRI